MRAKSEHLNAEGRGGVSTVRPTDGVRRSAYRDRSSRTNGKAVELSTAWTAYPTAMPGLVRSIGTTEGSTPWDEEVFA